MIAGRLRGDRLEEFLKLAFGIFQDRNCGKLPKSAEEFSENEFTRGLESAVEEDCAENGLEGICEGRLAFATAVQFFAAAENEILTEVELAGALGQGAAINQLGASFGERTFAEGRELLVKLAGKNELEDGIAEELEPLVSLHREALFVGNGRMS